MDRATEFHYSLSLQFFSVVMPSVFCWYSSQNPPDSFQMTNVWNEGEKGNKDQEPGSESVL